VYLLKGSLQTFLNAFTYPDRTCYVVASQNLKDFYNLANVYADAVFHPRCISDPMVHAQEGWHLELENKEDPLTYKGVGKYLLCGHPASSFDRARVDFSIREAHTVSFASVVALRVSAVYNEMKGVYSSPDSLLSRASQRSLFPDNTYSVDSGGDPRVIPELSFDQFADFHRKFYSPSNARIYFSGDDDVYARLELIDGYLKEFDATPESKAKSEIEWQPKVFTEPKKEVQYYPSGESQPDTHMIQLNWLLNDRPLSDVEELTLGLLDHLLMGTSSSILRKTLMESSLGEAITGGGLSDELLQATFSVGLKGVEADKVEEVEKLILDTLASIAEKGFTSDEIAASLNTIEFQLREVSEKSLGSSPSAGIVDRTSRMSFLPPIHFQLVQYRFVSKRPLYDAGVDVKVAIRPTSNRCIEIRSATGEAQKPDR